MKALRDLKPYLKAYRRKYILGAGAVLFAAFFMVLKPRFVERAIDSIEGEVDLSFLALCAAGIVAAALARGVFLFLTRRFMIFASRSVENDLRDHIFEHLQKQTPGFFHENPTGDLMARATNDLAAVRLMVGPGIMYSVNTLVSGTFVLVNLFLIESTLALVTLAFLPVMAFAVYRFGRAIHWRFEKIQDQFGVVTARAQENLAGVRIIRSYVREKEERRLFGEANAEYVRLNRNYVLIESAFRPAIMLVVGLGFLLMLYMGGRFVIIDPIAKREFLAFAIYLTMLVWPAISIGWVTGLFQRGSASMKRIQRILDRAPLVSDQSGARAVDDASRLPIEIRDLNFRYSAEGPLVLKEINLKIEPATTTAIVGPTGAGKTTLLNLLVHLFPVERDRIFVGGRDINDISIESLRQLFGFVPQEMFLFSDTIGNNIAFSFTDDAPPPDSDLDAAIKASAAAAAFDGEVDSLPDRYDTMLGERGINLSGGQKQRCGIARALLKDPVIFVLDDALSAVDTETEDRILNNLKEVARQRTVIIVSHRVSAVRHADQIVVLRDGVIEERGRHDGLIEAGGLYADMVDQQRLKSEIEVI